MHRHEKSLCPKSPDDYTTQAGGAQRSGRAEGFHQENNREEGPPPGSKGHGSEDTAGVSRQAWRNARSHRGGVRGCHGGGRRVDQAEGGHVSPRLEDEGPVLLELRRVRGTCPR
jgi:hypothetical protein